jgi:hypothetical protein
LLQAKLQLPCRQTPAPFGGALQVAPHPPQFCALEPVSTQAPLQATSSLAQLPSPGVLVFGVAPWPTRTHFPDGMSHTYPGTQRPWSSQGLPSKLVSMPASQAVPSPITSTIIISSRAKRSMVRSFLSQTRCNP